jgi:hypothetical protein
VPCKIDLSAFARYCLNLGHFWVDKLLVELGSNLFGHELLLNMIRLFLLRLWIKLVGCLAFCSVLQRIRAHQAHVVGFQ